MNNDHDHMDAWIKHLQMVQDVISRQANSAAWTKRLCLIIVAGTVAFTGRNGGSSAGIIWMAMGLVVVFWVIDARYHQQECWFRTMYEGVRKRGYQEIPDFSLTPEKSVRDAHSLLNGMSGWSTRLLYGALLVFLFLFNLEIAS